jgi:hypothetical protein
LLCERERWSAPKLAERLSDGALDGYVVSDANIRRWWAGQNAPRRRDVIETLERILHAPGELLPLLGYAAGPPTEHDVKRRLDHLESLVDEILARLEAN